MAMGSLIKNPGGTLAPGGGYVAGPHYLLDRVSASMSAPGVGREAGGISADEQRLLMQGVYKAMSVISLMHTSMGSLCLHVPGQGSARHRRRLLSYVGAL